MPVPNRKVPGYNRRRLNKVSCSICSPVIGEAVFFCFPIRHKARMPFRKVKAKRPYEIMMSDTCQLSHGDANTGMRGVICGFISPK